MPSDGAGDRYHHFLRDVIRHRSRPRIAARAEALRPAETVDGTG